MAAISSISDSDLRAARSAGFKRKKPKKPKASASLSSMENFITRYNAWVKAAKDKIAAKKKKEGDKSKAKALRAQISKL